MTEHLKEALHAARRAAELDAERQVEEKIMWLPHHGIGSPSERRATCHLGLGWSSPTRFITQKKRCKSAENSVSSPVLKTYYKKNLSFC